MKEPLNNKYVVGQVYYSYGWNEQFLNVISNWVYMGVIESEGLTDYHDGTPLHQFKLHVPEDFRKGADGSVYNYFGYTYIDDPEDEKLTWDELCKTIISDHVIEGKRNHPLIEEDQNETVETNDSVKSKYTPSGKMIEYIVNNSFDVEKLLSRQEQMELVFDYYPTRSDLELISQLPQNLGLSFVTKLNSLEVLEPLTGKENIKSLWVSRIPKPEAGFLDWLETLHALQDLNLFYSRVSDAIGVCLDELEDLYFLNLSGTKITDWIRSDIATCQTLIRLTLDNTKISDDFFNFEDPWPLLTDLSLRATGIGDRGLELIQKIPKLEHLNLAQTQITDAGIPILKQMQQLESLHVEQTRISFRGAQELIAALENCWVRC